MTSAPIQPTPGMSQFIPPYRRKRKIIPLEFVPTHDIIQYVGSTTGGFPTL